MDKLYSNIKNDFSFYSVKNMQYIKVFKRYLFVGLITPNRYSDILKFADLYKRYKSVTGKTYPQFKLTKNKVYKSERFTKYLYELEVRVKTEEQPLHLVSNITKRGKDYHLDHIISVKQGYDLGISTDIISNISNLQILSAKENMLKGSFYCLDWKNIVGKALLNLELSK